MRKLHMQFYDVICVQIEDWRFNEHLESDFNQS